MDLVPPERPARQSGDRLATVVVLRSGTATTTGPASVDELIGSTVVGWITELGTFGRVSSQVQVWGTAVRAGPAGLVLEDPGSGLQTVVPPELDAIDDACPGAYRVRGREDPVTDPDWVATWVVETTGRR